MNKEDLILIQALLPLVDTDYITSVKYNNNLRVHLESIGVSNEVDGSMLDIASGELIDALDHRLKEAIKELEYAASVDRLNSRHY